MKLPVGKTAFLALAAVACLGNPAAIAAETYKIAPHLYEPHTPIAQAVKEMDSFREMNHAALKAAQEGNCKEALDILLMTTDHPVAPIRFLDASKPLRKAVEESLKGSFQDSVSVLDLCQPKTQPRPEGLAI